MAIINNPVKQAKSKAISVYKQDKMDAKSLMQTVNNGLYPKKRGKCPVNRIAL